MNRKKESCHLKENLPCIASDTAKALYFYPQWSGHFVCKPDFYIDRQNGFSSFLLLATVEGEGRLFSENREYVLKAGTVALLDCRTPHRYCPIGDGWDFSFLHFYGSNSEALVKQIREKNGSPIISVSDSEGDAVAAAIREIYRFSSEGDELSASEGIYKLLLFLARLTENLSDRKGLYKALSYVAAHYSEPITASCLAATIPMSRAYFSVAFKKRFGVSPYDYIKSYRLAAAESMLLTSDLSIDTIATKCGFSDASSFIRAFKKQNGISPAAYRKKRM